MPTFLLQQAVEWPDNTELRIDSFMIALWLSIIQYLIGLGIYLFSDKLQLSRLNYLTKGLRPLLTLLLE